MTRKPLISVVIAAWNAEEFIESAITSLIRQSYRNFELVIVDDCSTDRTPDLVENVKDSRVQLLRLNRNSGTATALLYGLKKASGDWIARQDADDLSHPLRLSMQLRAARALGGDSIVGSAALLTGAARGIVSKRVTHGQLQAQLLFHSPMIHSSIFAHRETFRAQPYDPRFIHVEDFDFIEGAVRAGIRLFNLPVPLVKYRVHAGMKSSLPGDAAKLEAQEVQGRMLSLLEIEPTKLEIDIHYGMAIRSTDHFSGRIDKAAVVAWRKKLLRQNHRTHVFPSLYLKQVLTNRSQTLLSLLQNQNPTSKYARFSRRTTL